MSDTGDDHQPAVRPEDALQVAQRALAKANELSGELDELREEYDDIVEDLMTIQLRLSEIDENRPYESLTLDEKVGMVREHGFNKALDRGGRAKLDYDDVMWEVFDGRPGTKHCYKLIRLAAGLDDDQRTGSNFPGFKARDPDNDSYHLAVDAEQAKRSRAFFPENKGNRGEVWIE